MRLFNGEETEVRLRFRPTVGGVLMWISFFLPFICNFFSNSGLSVLAVMMATAGLLVLGYLIACWEDAKSRKAFSFLRLTYVLAMLFIYAVLTPVFVSAGVASAKVMKR